MAVFVPTEGLAFLSEYIIDKVDTDRGTNLELGLFVDVSVNAGITENTITEPTGDYARITLVDADWTPASGDLRTYVQQIFQAGVGGWPEQVMGSFIATTGTTPRLIAVDTDPGAPYNMTENDTYKVTPTLVFSGPA